MNEGDQEQTNTDTVFFNVLKENLLFMRHQETQRMWIANVFVAIIAGFLAFTGKDGPATVPWYAYLALAMISLLCLLITLKLNHVFIKTRDATEEILISGKISSFGQNWNKYMPLLRSEGIWHSPVLSVRWLYVTLYSAAAVGFLALWVSKLLDC